MKTPFYLRQSRIVSVGQSYGVVPLASLLAFGVVSWEHVVHAYILGHGDTLAGHFMHILRDGFLALPLALLAVTGSLWLAQRLGMRHHTWLYLLGQAAIISTIFALLLVPAV